VSGFFVVVVVVVVWEAFVLDVNFFVLVIGFLDNRGRRISGGIRRRRDGIRGWVRGLIINNLVVVLDGGVGRMH
jgi:hypothetical protein